MMKSTITVAELASSLRICIFQRAQHSIK